MITKMSHISMYVLDQEQARKFYTDKLGFEVRADMTMDDGYRWLTVGLKGQPDLEMVLLKPVAGPMYDAETVEHIRALLEKGLMGAGVFETPDCRATYEELKNRGVEFLSPPKEQPYGIEALFKDGCGNWFSLTEHK